MNVKKNSLVCFKGVLDQGVLYAFNNHLGLIMKYDLKDFSYEIVGRVRSGLPFHDTVIRMLLFEGDIYLIMFRTMRIVRYNITNKNITAYSFSEKILGPNELMWEAFMYETRIWEFSASVGCGIYIFDCQTGKYVEYCSIKELFEKQNLSIESDAFFSNMFQIGNEVWAAVCGTKYVFSFHLDEMDVTVFTVDCEGINSFDYDGEEFWITVTGTATIMNWSPDCGTTNYFYVNEINFRDYPSCYVAGTDNRVLVVPNSDKDFCSIDRTTGKYKFLPFIGNYQKLSLNQLAYPFGGYIRTGDIMILFPHNIDKIVVIDLRNESVTYIDGALKKEDYEREYVKNELYKGGVEEAGDYKLTDYLAYLHKDAADPNREKKSKNTGEKIFKKIKDGL